MSLLEEGQTIRETYEVERFLGQGAFAEVYRVKHRFLGRQAMKVFKRAGMTIAEIEEMLGRPLCFPDQPSNIVQVLMPTIETPAAVGFHHEVFRWQS
jgi:serine/threonine-protein kinase